MRTLTCCVPRFQRYHAFRQKSPGAIHNEPPKQDYERGRPPLIEQGRSTAYPGTSFTYPEASPMSVPTPLVDLMEFAYGRISGPTL